MNALRLSSLIPLSFIPLLLNACAHHPRQAVTEQRAPAPGHETLPLVGKLRVSRFVLPNGLKLLVVEDHSSPTFAYQTWYRVGSRDEVPGRTGLAHLFEHMMFKGTRNHKEGEFDRILESNGVEGENAFTTRDFTAYIQELPKGKLDLIASLEADRMVNLVVNDESFKTEREVVQNERRYRNENNPDGTMYQELFELGFTKSPYHWPVIGYADDLARMTAEDARNFYKAYYSPNHATVIVTGDVDTQEVLATVQRYYGDLPKAESPVHVIETDPPQEHPRHKTLKLNMQVEKLQMGYRIPGIADADMPALNTLSVVLTGGKSSRLYRALVDTGIASAVETYDLEEKDPSLFIVAVNLQKDKTAAQAETIIRREIEKLAKEPVSKQELDKARNRLKFGFYEGLESNSSRANFLGRYETVTPQFQDGVAIFEKSLAVTPADLQRITQRYLLPKNRTAITGVPK